MFKENTGVMTARSRIARPTESVAGVINEAIGRHLIVAQLKWIYHNKSFQGSYHASRAINEGTLTFASISTLKNESNVVDAPKAASRPWMERFARLKALQRHCVWAILTADTRPTCVAKAKLVPYLHRPNQHSITPMCRSRCKRTKASKVITNLRTRCWWSMLPT